MNCILREINYNGLRRSLNLELYTTVILIVQIFIDDSIGRDLIFFFIRATFNKLFGKFNKKFYAANLV